MTNIYHSLLHGEGGHARAEGGNGGGGGVGRMYAVGGGDGIYGGAGAQFVTARLARHLFHIVLKAYVGLAERSRTFKEWKRCVDWMEIVKIMERKSGVVGNGAAPSVIT